MIAFVHNASQNNVARRLFKYNNSATESQDTLHKTRPLSSVIMSPSVIVDNSPPRFQPPQGITKGNKSEENVPKCRLKRIQSRDRVSIADTRLTQPHFSSESQSSRTSTPTTTIHPNPDPDAPPQKSHSYPFPPPGLSKPTPNTMITPEAEAASSTPRELELKCDSASAVGDLAQEQGNVSSLWNTFQLESFLGNFGQAGSKLALPPIIQNDPNEDELNSLPSTPILTPATLPVAFCDPPKDSDPFSSDDIMLQFSSDLNPNALCPSFASSFSQPLSPLTATSSPPRQISSSHYIVPLPNPFMLQRRRQQAFMTGWNRVRERNRHAPLMPSFFNPMRNEAPACSWTFLRDPACCSGVRNSRMNGKRVRDGVFERALAKLPLTRCRNICDRVRQDQQVMGWGAHAWLGSSKHCHYCASDTLLKGFLAYRAFALEARREKENEMAKRQSRLLSPLKLDMAGIECSEATSNPGHEWEREDEDEENIEPGAILLNFPYGNRSSERLNESWVNYNGLDSTSSSYDAGDDNVDSDRDNCSGELEKRLLQSPIIRDLDEFDLEDEDEDDGYSSSGSDEDVCEGDENNDLHGEDKGEKARGKVLTSYWEDDADEEGWVEDIHVVEVEIQA